MSNTLLPVTQRYKMFTEYYSPLVARNMTEKDLAAMFSVAPSTMCRWIHTIDPTNGKPRKRKTRIEGQRFERVVVLEDMGEKRVKCQCDCGTVFYCNRDDLRYGKTRSCGCLRSELTSKRRKNREIGR